MKPFRKHILAGAVLAAGATVGFSAQATTLQITVTNNQANGGLSVTPLYTAIHNGSFDAFTLGEAATPGVETIAETGNPMPVAGERLAVDPSSVGLVLASPSGPPPVQPGESVSDTVEVTATGPLYFSFLSMLLPSNDHFIGNDNPLAYQVFDAAGAFTGDLSISVTGNQIYDAGTEANGLTGAAFIAGVDIADSPAGEGVIQQGIGLSPELLAPGVTLATGDMLNASLIDFTSSPGDFDLLTITISEVAPIPLPAGAPLMLSALGLMGWYRHRKAKA
jgi:hypothetical protein